MGVAVLKHPPSQADLLKADLDRLADQRNAALLRREEAVRVKIRAVAAVENATAAISDAETEADTLAEQIDVQLEALNRLIPRPR